jgi:hypothetical protein
VFTFVAVDERTPEERAVFDQTDAILALRGGRLPNVHEILVSETMRLGASGYAEAAGLWEPKERRIVVKRSELQSSRRMPARFYSRWPTR